MRRLTLAALLALAAFGAATDARPADSQARVTIFARPTVVAWTQTATVFGAVSGTGGPRDIVKVQVKECGSPGFRTYAEAHLNAGGGWSMPVGTSVTSTFRAVWGSTTSVPVTIRQGANVGLARRRSGTGFVVGVTATRSFWRRQVEIQRRTGGSWRTVRTIRLTDSVSSTGVVSASEATFRLPVPGGTLLRALLPLSQAKPCYVQSVSKVVRAP
jgi:hypothetical protein